MCVGSERNNPSQQTADRGSAPPYTHAPAYPAHMLSQTAAMLGFTGAGAAFNHASMAGQQPPGYAFRPEFMPPFSQAGLPPMGELNFLSFLITRAPSRKSLSTQVPGEIYTRPNTSSALSRNQRRGVNTHETLPP